MSRQRPEKIAYLDDFRGLAMLIIVAGHSYPIAFADDPHRQLDAFSPVLALVTGGTAYFVFISGFLYCHLFHGRKSLPSLLRSKAQNVLQPYLWFAVPLAFAQMVREKLSVDLAVMGEEVPRSLFAEFVLYIATGAAAVPYWFVPMIFLIFLASPAFDAFIRLGLRERLLVLAAAMVTALAIHRSSTLDPVQNMLYFTPYYLFGILCAQHRERFIALAAHGLGLGLAAALVAAIVALQVGVLADVENVHALPFTPVLDLMFVQKLAGIVLLCGLLHRFGRYAGGLFANVATVSFAIFFMHPIVIYGLGVLGYSNWALTGLRPLDLATTTLAVTGICMAVVHAARAVAGPRTRYVLGA